MSYGGELVPRPAGSSSVVVRSWTHGGFAFLHCTVREAGNGLTNRELKPEPLDPAGHNTPLLPVIATGRDDRSHQRERSAKVVS